MKFLLWAYLIYVSFARDYSDNIGSPYPVIPSATIPYPVIPSATIPYPVIPSATIPYPVIPSASIPHPMPDSDFTPPVYLTKTNFPNYPANPDPDTAVPTNPLVFTALGAPLYSIASLPRSFSRQPPPTGVFLLVPASSRPVGPFYPPNEAVPSADNIYIVEILVPPTTPPPTLPDVQPLTVIEPDEAEPAAAAHAAPEPQSSISFDQVRGLSLSPVMHKIYSSRKETVSP
ncbi:proline-rich protein 27 [Moschus berezovskii]|uniref:proline-rich protein 27 n=1 Tax=Moschus berezovskii TaxID=68408 RepID=UPI0024451BDD|nr:proline-rich protein 27 [Moschus berezovskii]